MADTGAIQLVGAAQLQELLRAYPASVAAAATRTGMRKAGRQLRDYLAAAAPEKSGTLRKALVVYRRRGKDKYSPRIAVGLGKIRGESGIRFYYKVLEMTTQRGAALSPFFLNAWNAHREQIAQVIVDETRKAVYSEAARIHRKTLGLKKRR